MEFTNVVFLFFMLPVFLSTYYMISNKFKNIVILASSFVMLFWCFTTLLFKMIFLTLLTYLLGYLICKANIKFVRCVLVFLAILFSILFYVYFYFEAYKGQSYYVEFIFNHLFATIFVMNNISYVVDIYKNRVGHKNSVLDCFLFVFMFFKFYLGPVVPYYKIKNSIEKRTVKICDVALGIEEFIFGFFKISVLCYETGQIKRFVLIKYMEDLSFFSAWMGAIAIFFNLYFYFSGYCDIAAGFGKITGFNIPKNFSSRFYFKSLTSFFKNFNITFINYFKFYIFPWVLEKKLFLKYFKYFIIMLLYVACFFNIFAVIYFCMIIFLEILFLNKILVKIPEIFREIYSFILILIGTVIFNINDLGDILKYLKYMFFGGKVFFDKSLLFIIIILRFFGILVLFFLLRFLIKWFKKSSFKYEKIFEFLKYLIFLTLFLVAIFYCLTV